NLLAVQISGGAISETAAGIDLLNELSEQFPDLRQVWCDQGFRRGFVERAAQLGITATVISRAPGTVGFRVLPRRWVVERFFAWISRARRLARDFERLASAAVAMVEIAYTRMMLRRLTRPAQPSPHI
ncbi:transposase, partial [Kineococcus rhizosphaerae]